MNRQWNFVQSFWEPRRGPLVFFAVAYVFGVSVNVASNHVGDAAWIFLYVVPVLLAGFILSPWAVGLITRLWRVAEVGGATLRPAGKYRGVVVFASPGAGINTARQAIEHHGPAHAWIFCSDSSEKDAKALEVDLIGRGIVSPEGVHHRKLSDDAFADPEAVRAAIESEVYENLEQVGLSETDVVIDFTGGKKETTAGALLAGLPPGRNLEVVRPKAVDQNMRGTDPGAVLEIDLRYKLRPVRRSGSERS